MAELKFLVNRTCRGNVFIDERAGEGAKTSSTACDLPSQYARLSQGDGVLALVVLVFLRLFSCLVLAPVS